ncbi:hypothetical protein PoB_003080900 [Plakobranchus ocellatus]|uniref:Uncharacterized protein n=1 Tax=Plakobranchus ocellatus TaxID=259542 RepID=A0AAV4ADK7_9GAST|nr:hypothetical protein PoB_003080900 [Plakobranchus ocellatus]
MRNKESDGCCLGSRDTVSHHHSTTASSGGGLLSPISLSSCLFTTKAGGRIECIILALAGKRASLTASVRQSISTRQLGSLTCSSRTRVVYM